MSASGGFELKSSSRLTEKSTMSVPGGLVNVSPAEAPLAIALPPSMRRPISEPAGVQFASTTSPATAGPLQERLPQLPPPAAQA